MPSDLHERLIWQASKQGWRTEPWKPAVLERLNLQPWVDDIDDRLREMLTGCRLMPDAWRWEFGRDRDCDFVLRLRFLEVVVTNWPTQAKMEFYAELWSELDCTARLEFELVIMGRDGHCVEPDLYRAWSQFQREYAHA